MGSWVLKKLTCHWKQSALALSVAVVAMAAGGCSTAKVSDNLYRDGEVGLSKRVLRCRVLEVREVAIRGDDRGEAGGVLGNVIGGIIGAAAANSVGKGSGRVIAKTIGAGVGTVAGNAAGRQLGDKLSERKGVEYSIILSNGDEQTHVQDLREGDRVINVGESCRLQVSHDGRNRVLPAEHITSTIKAPKQTKIVP